MDCGIFFKNCVILIRNCVPFIKNCAIFIMNCAKIVQDEVIWGLQIEAKRHQLHQKLCVCDMRGWMAASSK